MKQVYNEQLSFIHSCVNGLCEVKKIGVKHMDQDGKKEGMVLLRKNGDSIIKHVKDVDYESLLDMLGSSGKTLEHSLQEMLDGKIDIPELDGEIVERRKRHKKQKKNTTVRRIRKNNKK